MIWGIFFMNEEQENTGWTLGGEVQEQHEAFQQRMKEKNKKKKSIYRMPSDK